MSPFCQPFRAGLPNIPLASWRGPQPPKWQRNGRRGREGSRGSSTDAFAYWHRFRAMLAIWARLPCRRGSFFRAQHWYLPARPPCPFATRAPGGGQALKRMAKQRPFMTEAERDLARKLYHAPTQRPTPSRHASKAQAPAKHASKAQPPAGRPSKSTEANDGARSGPKGKLTCNKESKTHAKANHRQTKGKLQRQTHF